MRTVTHLVKAVEHIEGEGMFVRRSIPNTQFRDVDPFLLLDHMGPRDFGPGEGRGAPDHPHRGFETVTYVLEGKMQHRDSQGNVGDLNAGDVQWMTAGAGVVHSEMPHPELQITGGRMHGFQLWVNLPAKDKMMEPRYQDIPAQRIPEVPFDGGVVRVIAGEFDNQRAVIDTRTPITYLHAKLEPGAGVNLPAPEGHNAFAYTIVGEGEVAGTAVPTYHLARLGDGDSVHVQAGPHGLELLLVTGQPIGEPYVQWGPFVMTTKDEIVQAVHDFQQGKMGTIPVQIG